MATRCSHTHNYLYGFPPDSHLSSPMKVWRQEKIPTSSIIASRRTIAHRQRCQVRLRSYVKEIKRKVTTVDGESEIIIKSYLWLTFRHLAPAHSLKITKCHPGITPFRHQIIMLSGHHIAMSSCRIWKPSHHSHSFETLGVLRGRMRRRPRWRVSPSTSFFTPMTLLPEFLWYTKP